MKTIVCGHRNPDVDSVASAFALAELKRALSAYKGSILMVCHEPEFYQDIVDAVWDCTRWTTRVF